jgi:hypothetical protein
MKCSRLMAAVVIVAVLIQPTYGLQAERLRPDARARAITRIALADGRGESIQVVLTDGRRLTGIVRDRDADGCELVVSGAPRYVPYAQVASASATRNAWITVGVVSASLVVWWLARNCFFRC